MTTSTSSASTPTLFVLGGLPGVGKTTLARALAARVRAVHLRIDTIEQALRNCPRFAGRVEEEGYRVAFALAEDNLRLGQHVVADAVNAEEEARHAWRDAARRANAKALEIEVVCSDEPQHQARIASRGSDIPGLQLPTWQAVRARSFAHWSCSLRLDTAHQTVARCVDAIVERLEAE